MRRPRHPGGHRQHGRYGTLSGPAYKLGIRSTVQGRIQIEQIEFVLPCRILADAAFPAGKYPVAAEVIQSLVMNDTFADFMTLAVCEYLG